MKILTKIVASALTLVLHVAPLCAEDSGIMVKDMSWGPIELTFKASSTSVDYMRDILITIRSVSDAGTTVMIPSMEDRLSGFIMSGEFETTPVTANGRVVLEKNIRLTPTISDEHRIGPMAITFRTDTDNRKSWFATSPVTFEAPSIDTNAGKDIEENIKPVWIYPSTREVISFFIIALLCGAAAWGASRLISRFRLEAKLRKMSPTERAMRELDILLSRQLPEKSCFKEFYIELTMIVRRYIERAHDVRAPEQTTEEFLEAASSDTRFSENALATLKQFLEAADLVKFAAYQPGSDTASDASETARRYIVADEQTEVQHD